MARNENPPFDRGQSYFNGGTVDDTLGAQLLGKEWVFEDRDPASMTIRTNRDVRVRAVRNDAGFNVLPKRLAQLNAAGDTITGYAAVNPQDGYPIDEYIPSAGIPDGDILYVVVDGPAMVSTGLAADATNVIAAGDRVCAATAATSGATTAGRVVVQDLAADLTGGSDVTSTSVNDALLALANQIQKAIGVAMSAKTTANTAADLLIKVEPKSI
jgi:hypothetical protein